MNLVQVLSYIRYYVLFAYCLLVLTTVSNQLISNIISSRSDGAYFRLTLSSWDHLTLWIWFKLNILCFFTSLTSLTIELGNIVHPWNVGFLVILRDIIFWHFKFFAGQLLYYIFAVGSLRNKKHWRKSALHLWFFVTNFLWSTFLVFYFIFTLTKYVGTPNDISSSVRSSRNHHNFDVCSMK